MHEGTRRRFPGGTTRRCSYIAPLCRRPRPCEAAGEVIRTLLADPMRRASSQSTPSLLCKCCFPSLARSSLLFACTHTHIHTHTLGLVTGFFPSSAHQIEAYSDVTFPFLSFPIREDSSCQTDHTGRLCQPLLCDNVQA